MDYDELMAYIEQIMAEKCSSDDVVDAFNLIDEDGSGEVSHQEVSKTQQCSLHTSHSPSD